MTTLERYDAILATRITSAHRLHLTPLSQEELDDLNVILMARAVARADALEQRWRDLQAIVTVGEVVSP
jgi:hypothetical protein